MLRYVCGQPFPTPSTANATRNPDEQSLIASDGHSTKYVRGCNGIRVATDADTDGLLVYDHRPHRSVVLQPRDVISGSTNIRFDTPVWGGDGTVKQPAVELVAGPPCTVQFIYPGRFDPPKEGGMEIAFVVQHTAALLLADIRVNVELKLGALSDPEVLRGTFTVAKTLPKQKRHRAVLQLNEQKYVECADGVPRQKVPQTLADVPDPLLSFQFTFPDEKTLVLLSVHIDTFPLKP